MKEGRMIAKDSQSSPFVPFVVGAWWRRYLPVLSKQYSVTTAVSSTFAGTFVSYGSIGV